MHLTVTSYSDWLSLIDDVSVPTPPPAPLPPYMVCSSSVPAPAPPPPTVPRRARERASKALSSGDTCAHKHR